MGRLKHIVSRCAGPLSIAIDLVGFVLGMSLMVRLLLKGLAVGAGLSADDPLALLGGAIAGILIHVAFHAISAVVWSFRDRRHPMSRTLDV